MKIFELIYKNIRLLFQRYYPWSLLFFIFITVIVSVWQLTQLYFWGDDWDLFLKVQNPSLDVWRTGSGPFGVGPYRYFHTVFLFLYPFFHLNAGAYFNLGILIYFIAALCIYILIMELTQKKSLALGASLLFASGGYIGAQAFEHLQHLYAMLGTIIFTCLFSFSLLRHFKSRKIAWYILSLALFTFLDEFYVLRAQGSIFVVFALSLLFVSWRKRFEDILVNIVKIIPFILIYLRSYLVVYDGGYGWSFGDFMKLLYNSESFGYFMNFFGTISNIIVPDNLTKVFYQITTNDFHVGRPEIFLLIIFTFLGVWIVRKKKFKIVFFLSIIFINIFFFFYLNWAVGQSLFWSYDEFDKFTIILGQGILLTTLLIIFTSWKTHNIESRLILFGIFWFFGQYIGYFVASPQDSMLISGHRYLAPSLVATAIILSGVIMINGIKKIGIIIFSTIIIFFVFNINMELANVVNAVSSPTQKLYKDIRAQIKTLPKNPIIFADFKKDPQVMQVGPNSYLSTGFALFYGQSTWVKKVSSMDELLRLIKKREVSINDVVSLYIDENGAKNTTDVIRSLLSNRSPYAAINNNAWSSTTSQFFSDESFATNPLMVKNSRGTFGVNPTLEIKVPNISVVPMLLTVNFSAKPIDFADINFPYRDITNKVYGKIAVEGLSKFDLENDPKTSVLCDQNALLLRAEEEHQEFIKTAKVVSASYWQDNIPSNLIDGKYDTDWTANLLDWGKLHNVNVEIDLGSIKKISRFIWVNHFIRSAPITYSLLLSDDGVAWKEVRKIINGKKKNDDEITVELFPQTNARYVKMIIYETFSGKFPSLRELWVDSIGGNLNDWDLIRKITSFPFSCSIENLENANTILGILGNKIKARIWWITDATGDYRLEDSQEFDITSDGQNHEYVFYLPSGGLELKSLKIDNFQIPLDVSVNNASIHSLSFSELNSVGYIQD